VTCSLEGRPTAGSVQYLIRQLDVELAGLEQRADIIIAKSILK
jgi:hypothetical protein